jgi:hypothetical protein
VVQGPSISRWRRKHQTQDFGQISIWNFLYLSLPRRSSTSSSPASVCRPCYISLWYLCDTPCNSGQSRHSFARYFRAFFFRSREQRTNLETRPISIQTSRPNQSTCVRVRRKHAVQALPAMDCPSGQSNQPQSPVHPNPEPIRQIWTNLLLHLDRIHGGISVMVAMLDIFLDGIY